jgi:hypothetical protein
LKRVKNILYQPIYDVDEAPTIQLSNSTILNGSAAYTPIGQITANDVDSDNTKLEYSLSGVDKEYFLRASSSRSVTVTVIVLVASSTPPLMPTLLAAISTE